MEAYDPDAVFSSIDHQGRYAYGQQASIAQWNLARFAENLLPLMGEDSDRAVAQATEVIERFPAVFKQAYLQRMAAKLACRPAHGRRPSPKAVESAAGAPSWSGCTTMPSTSPWASLAWSAWCRANSTTGAARRCRRRASRAGRRCVVGASLACRVGTRRRRP